MCLHHLIYRKIFTKVRILRSAAFAVEELPQQVAPSTSKLALGLPRVTLATEERDALADNAVSTSVFRMIHCVCAGVSIIVITHRSLARALPPLENNDHAH